MIGYLKTVRARDQGWLVDLTKRKKIIDACPVDPPGEKAVIGI
jgi:hypothetical protein